MQLMHAWVFILDPHLCFQKENDEVVLCAALTMNMYTHGHTVYAFNSLAYIHSVHKAGKGEAVTALSLFRELEAKGVFSADDVEPLEEVLRGINRLDLANTVVKDFKVKLKGEGRGRLNEESTASAGGQEGKGRRGRDGYLERQRGGVPVTCELLQLPGDGSQDCSLDKYS